MGADDETKRGFKKASPIKAAKREAAAKASASWRDKLRASALKFDDVQKGIYLNVLRKTGERGTAAKAAGVSRETVNRHRNEDVEFANAWDEAWEDYCDVIHRHAFKVAVDGVDEPLLGGKFKDEVVAYKRTFATNILAMEMRRTNAEYKERQEIDVNQKGGVLIVPAGVDMDEYIKQEMAAAAGKQQPGAEKNDGSK